MKKQVITTVLGLALSLGLSNVVAQSVERGQQGQQGHQQAGQKNQGQNPQRQGQSDRRGDPKQQVGQDRPSAGPVNVTIHNYHSDSRKPMANGKNQNGSQQAGGSNNKRTQTQSQNDSQGNSSTNSQQSS